MNYLIFIKIYVLTFFYIKYLRNIAIWFWIRPSCVNIQCPMSRKNHIDGSIRGFHFHKYISPSPLTWCYVSLIYIVIGPPTKTSKIMFFYLMTFDLWPLHWDISQILSRSESTKPIFVHIPNSSGFSCERPDRHTHRDGTNYLFIPWTADAFGEKINFVTHVLTHHIHNTCMSWLAARISNMYKGQSASNSYVLVWYKVQYISVSEVCTFTAILYIWLKNSIC